MDNSAPASLLFKSGAAAGKKREVRAAVRRSLTALQAAEPRGTERIAYSQTFLRDPGEVPCGAQRSLDIITKWQGSLVSTSGGKGDVPVSI